MSTLLNNFREKTQRAGLVRCSPPIQSPHPPLLVSQNVLLPPPLQTFSPSALEPSQYTSACMCIQRRLRVTPAVGREAHECVSPHRSTH
jgi:hypothetical protein